MSTGTALITNLTNQRISLQALRGCKTRSFAAVLGFFLLHVLLLSAPVLAEEGNGLTREQLLDTQERLRNDDSYNPTTKSEILELTRRSLEYLDTVETQREIRQRYTNLAAEAPVQIEQLESRVATLKRNLAQDPDIQTEGIDSDTLEQNLLQARTEQASLNAALREADSRLEDARSSLPQARNRLPLAEQELFDLSETSVSLPVGRDATDMTLARARLEATRTSALNAEISTLNQAIATYGARIELRELEREIAFNELELHNQKMRVLENAVNKKRLNEAEQVEATAEAVRQDSANKHPVLRRAAERNARLAVQLKEIVESRRELNSDVEDTVSQIQQLSEDFENTRLKLEVADLSETVGQALRDRRRDLPKVKDLRAESLERATQAAQITLDRIELREERQALLPLPDAIAEIVAPLSNVPSAANVTDLRGLLAKRLELIDKTSGYLQNYAATLAELDYQSQKLIDVTTRYDQFLDERLLWVRSSVRPSLTALQNLPKELARLLDIQNWKDILSAINQGLIAAPYWFLTLLAFVYLVWRRKEILSGLKQTAQRLGKPSTDRLLFTLHALVLSLVAALPWPILVATLGWMIRQSPYSTDFTQAIGHGLTWVSAQIYLLESFRVLCKPYGLGATHFRWPARSLVFLRRTIIQVMPVLFTTSFFTVFFMYFDQMGLAGTLTFTLVAISLSWFLYRILNPKGPVLTAYMTRHPASLITKTRLLWFPLSVGLPLFLAGYALNGFLFTSALLTSSFVQSLWLVLTVLVVYAVAVRWLLITRRKLAYEAALERRAAALKAAESEGKADGEIEDLRAELELPNIDLVALDIQSRKLLSLGVVLSLVGGFWWIWSDLVPAFGFLDNVQLWQHTVEIAGKEALAPITLGDLLLAVVVGVITVVLAKSLPTFIEVVLLQRFEISAGSRYAITTLSGYAIAAIGVLWAVNTIGANWSQLQWLVAALGVGIGFGLQEIVANFISGLIILFEQPIRVGDVVTIGETDGVVSRIQIRATTIRNWDKKELLVPNKEFITGRLLNWSLSDQMNRVNVNVGIAYGSDVEKALHLLEQAAREHENVLTDPSPLVIFEGFGDSSLDISLRCYLSSLDNRLVTMSELNRAVNRMFTEAGISIPFPQRDVHLDTSKPLDVRIQTLSAPDP